MSFRDRTPTPPSGNTWLVQIGNQSNAYTTVLECDRAGRAILTYAGYNVHSGGKKRIVRNGKVMARHLTRPNGTEIVEPLSANALLF